MHYTGTGSGAGSGTNLSEGIEKIRDNFAVIEASEEVSAGTKVAKFLAGSIDAFSLSNDGITILDASLTMISLDIITEHTELSLFDLGNAGASFGVKSLIPYASAMVSLWSPSISFDLFGASISLAAHVGAIGFGISLVPGDLEFGFANGFGFSVSINNS